MNLKELDEAIKDFKKVVLIEPTNQAALNRMAECFQQKIKAKNNKQSQGAKKQDLEVKKQILKEELDTMVAKCPTGALAFVGATVPKAAMSSMGAMNFLDRSNMRDLVDYFYQNPSKMQNQEIPDFVTEYINMYGKNDYEKLFHLIIAFFGFCGTSSQSLDEQVDFV